MQPIINITVTINNKTFNTILNLVFVKFNSSIFFGFMIYIFQLMLNPHCMVFYISL